MKHLARFWPVLLIAGALIASAVSASRLTAARRAADASIRAADTALRQAQQILQARAATPGDLRPSTQQAVYTGVAERLHELALPPSSLAGVEEVAQRGASREGLAEQVVRIRLERLHPADLGRFLAAWRAAHPEWSVTQIHLAAPRTARQEEHDGRFDAQLVCSALRFDPSAAPNTQSPQ